jgi:hypothetical protein
MIMIDHFIGIIMNSMEEMHSELDEYNRNSAQPENKAPWTISPRWISRRLR